MTWGMAASVASPPLFSGDRFVSHRSCCRLNNNKISHQWFHLFIHHHTLLPLCIFYWFVLCFTLYLIHTAPCKLSAKACHVPFTYNHSYICLISTVIYIVLLACRSSIFLFSYLLPMLSHWSIPYLYAPNSLYSSIIHQCIRRSHFIRFNHSVPTHLICSMSSNVLDDIFIN